MYTLSKYLLNVYSNYRPRGAGGLGSYPVQLKNKYFIKKEKNYEKNKTINNLQFESLRFKIMLSYTIVG